MNQTKIAYHLCGVFAIGLLVWCIPTQVSADLTKEQSEGIATFATSFIEKGNERRDEQGYPLLVYALSNDLSTSIKIRRSGYFGELYTIERNAYHKRNGQYIALGNKWCMDCGDFISFVYHTTLGLDLMLPAQQDPWHIKDMYADACRGEGSQYFYFIYQNVPISSIQEEKLQKGDIVLRLGSRENHGLLYVGESMQTAHASRNAIQYGKNPPILGFQVVTLNKFYKTSTKVSIVRLKDGVVPQDQMVNGIVTWPDTGEIEDLLEIAQKERKQEAYETWLATQPTVLEAGVETQEQCWEAFLQVESAKKTWLSKEMVDWLWKEWRRLLVQLEREAVLPSPED